MENETRLPSPPPRDGTHADAPEIISTEDVRAGSTGNWVRYVLIASVLLAVAGMVYASFFVPGGLQEGATSAPGPK